MRHPTCLAQWSYLTSNQSYYRPGGVLWKDPVKGGRPSSTPATGEGTWWCRAQLSRLSCQPLLRFERENNKKKGERVTMERPSGIWTTFGVERSAVRTPPKPTTPGCAAKCNGSLGKEK